MNEYYIIRESTNSIINCVTSGRFTNEDAVRLFGPGHHVSTNPPMELLSRYQYYSERP